MNIRYVKDLRPEFPEIERRFAEDLMLYNNADAISLYNEIASTLLSEEHSDAGHTLVITGINPMKLIINECSVSRFHRIVDASILPFSGDGLVISQQRIDMINHGANYGSRGYYTGDMPLAVESLTDLGDQSPLYMIKSAEKLLAYFSIYRIPRYLFDCEKKQPLQRIISESKNHSFYAKLYCIDGVIGRNDIKAVLGAVILEEFAIYGFSKKIKNSAVRKCVYAISSHDHDSVYDFSKSLVNIFLREKHYQHHTDDLRVFIEYLGWIFASKKFPVEHQIARLIAQPFTSNNKLNDIEILSAISALDWKNYPFISSRKDTIKFVEQELGFVTANRIFNDMEYYMGLSDGQRKLIMMDSLEL